MPKTIKLCLSLATAMALCAHVLPSPAQAAGASLFLSPSSGSKTIGSSFTVNVKVNSGGNVINAAEGTVTYDTALLTFTGVSKSGSIFPFWTTEPAHSGGAIRFGGGLPPPAYKGTAGQIVAITFKAKAAGSARVALSSGAVLANDGKGTNIISGLGSASFTITAASDKPADKPSDRTDEPKAEAEPAYLKPAVSSPTHPDQNAWYNIKDALFKWELPSGVTGVSLSFNDQAVSDPGPSSDGLAAEKEFSADKDGVWYLHVKFRDAKRWGTAVHYRIMVDTTPPEPFEVQVRRTDPGEWPELDFTAKDGGSGIGKYELYVGSLEHQALELPADKPVYQVGGLESGEHTALVKAVDKAGNERLATVVFRVEPLPAPEITGFPDELRASDRFWAQGKALPGASVSIQIEQDGRTIASASTSADAAGNWSYVHGQGLPDGRYSFWVQAVNAKGIKSLPSPKPSFLVTPPVFAVVGGFVIRYFTLLVSIIFLSALTILIIFLIVWLLRNKLKKEAYEVEEVLKKNAEALKAELEMEFIGLSKAETKAAFKAESAKARERLAAAVDESAKKSLKEIRDVEKLIR